MQTVSSGWGNKTANGLRHIGYGVLVAWMRTIASGTKFFTINQSRIGGPDILKGGGEFVTFFDKYQFDDVSPFVQSISVQKRLGQYPYGIIMAQSDIELDNATKRFLPEYDTTIGSGILPNRPIKISVGIEDEYVKLFTGYTSQPMVSLNKRDVQIHSFDAFNYINGQKVVSSGVYVNAPFHNVVASGLRSMGFSDSQFILDKSLQQNIGYLAPNGQQWGDVFKDGAEAEQGLLFTDENGIIRFWNRQHFLTQSGTPRFQLSYSKLSDIKWENTPIINDVIVRAKPRVVRPFKRVYKQVSSIEILSGETREVFIQFSDSFGPLPVTNPVQPTYSSTELSTSYYSTNTESDGSGDANFSAISIVQILNSGDSYKVYFRNSSSSSMFITDMQIYGSPAEVSTVIDERYEDESSISNFGRNPSNNGEPIIIENDLIQDRSTAYSLAYTLVNEYKSARRRYTCPVAVQSDPALQIGDAGLLFINDTGQLKNVYLTGKTDIINRDATYQQTLEVEERSIKRYFTINQSRIGGTDSIAP